MFGRKSLLHAPANSYHPRPHAIRSSTIFPLATTAAAAPSSSSSSASPSPASSAPASLGGQSRLSIRPFDIRDSEADESSQPDSPPPAASQSALSASQSPSSPPTQAASSSRSRWRKNPATIHTVSVARHLRPTASDPGYSASGYGTSGWTYEERPLKHPVQALSEEERRQWREVAVEDAMRAVGLHYACRLRLKLKPTTLSKLHAAMRRETGELDRTVLRLCDTGRLSSKCGVYQILDVNTAASDLQYTVVTKQAVKQYEPVLAVMGALRERRSYEAWCGSSDAIAFLHSIDVHPNEMPASYSGPDLLFDTAHFTNEVRFLRDPRFSHRSVEANVEARLVWHQAAGLPYVVFVTLAAMPAGVELWKRWDVGSRQVAWRVQMKYAAKRSHCQWFYIGLLQDELRRRGLSTLPTALLRKRDAHSSSNKAEPGASQPAVEESKVGDEGKESRAEDESKQGQREEKQPSSLPQQGQAGGAAGGAAAGREWLDSVYIPFTWRESNSWTLHHVCAHALQEATTKENRRLRQQSRLLRLLRSGCIRTVSPQQAAETRRELDAARLPQYDFALLEREDAAFEESGCHRLTRNDWGGVEAQPAVMQQVADKYHKHEKEAYRLTEDVKACRRSGLVPKARIHRIVSLHHPARLYAPPHHHAFALVATAAVRKGACYGAYVGRIMTKEDYNASASPSDSVYAYEMDPLGLDMVIDGLSQGNALRFMNDSFARSGGRRTTNASPRYLFDSETRRPNCFMLCSREGGVRKGDEIVADYGAEYWSRICRALLREHGRYGDQARLLIDALLAELRQHGIEPPRDKGWDEVREQEWRRAGWTGRTSSATTARMTTGRTWRRWRTAGSRTASPCRETAAGQRRSRTLTAARWRPRSACRRQRQRRSSSAAPPAAAAGSGGEAASGSGRPGRGG